MVKHISCFINLTEFDEQMSSDEAQITTAQSHNDDGRYDLRNLPPICHWPNIRRDDDGQLAARMGALPSWSSRAVTQGPASLAGGSRIHGPASCFRSQDSPGFTVLPEVPAVSARPSGAVPAVPAPEGSVSTTSTDRALPLLLTEAPPSLVLTLGGHHRLGPWFEPGPAPTYAAGTAPGRTRWRCCRWLPTGNP
ncbi:hypothetical protein F4779DRAFT_467699 [Xylariaceae sp. FL0662B]|nr:hypothetical protein F4779DRAFT_467699 [Xylariaceae sp. FL0662B]